jgi:acetyltransferase
MSHSEGRDVAAVEAKPGACRASAIRLRGRRVTLRPMRADDRGLHEQFLATLPDRDLRLRFGPENSRLPVDQLARTLRRHRVRDIVFVATVRREGRRHIVGEVIARPDPGGAREEFAIVVAPDQQGSGLGRALLEKLIACARARGVGLLYGLVDRSNEAMLGLGRRLGFDVDDVPGGVTTVLSLELGAAARTAGGAALGRPLP